MVVQFGPTWNKIIIIILMWAGSPPSDERERDGLNEIVAKLM